MAYGGALSEVSNRASWIDVVEITDLETGETVDISAAQEIVVQVVSKMYDNYYRVDYGFGAVIAPSLAEGLEPSAQRLVMQREDLGRQKRGVGRAGRKVGAKQRKEIGVQCIPLFDAEDRHRPCIAHQREVFAVLNGRKPHAPGQGFQQHGLLVRSGQRQGVHQHVGRRRAPGHTQQ